MYMLICFLNGSGWRLILCGLVFVLSAMNCYLKIAIGGLFVHVEFYHLAYYFL